MKLLFVNGCISQRGEDSRTLALARTFLETWRARHPDGEIETVSPEALLALKPFEPEMLNDRDALAGIRCFDAPVFDLARQFRTADRIVVAAPFWDLTFPALRRRRGTAGEPGGPVLEAAGRHVRHPVLRLCVRRRAGSGPRPDGGAPGRGL